MSLDIYGICDHCGHEAFSHNITHNLNEMAMAAGIYEVLWRPDENGFTYAKDIIEYLEKGIADLKNRPKFFKKFDSPNGWGLYKHFLPWCEEVLHSCKNHPNIKIRVSR